MQDLHCKLIDSLINTPKVREIVDSIDFIPELNKAELVRQRGGISVRDHTIEVLECLDNRNVFTVLSALFHDLGKIHTRTFCKKDNSIKFDGHEYQSALIAKDRLSEIGLGEPYVDSIYRIIKTHMYNIMNTSTEISILKFIADVGRKNIEDWFTLRRADVLSYTPIEYRLIHSKEYSDKIITPFEKRVLKVLNSSEDNFDAITFFKASAYE